jgi:hypothetical protein
MPKLDSRCVLDLSCSVCFQLQDTLRIRICDRPPLLLRFHFSFFPTKVDGPQSRHCDCASHTGSPRRIHSYTIQCDSERRSVIAATRPSEHRWIILQLHMPTSKIIQQQAQQSPVASTNGIQYYKQTTQFNPELDGNYGPAKTSATMQDADTRRCSGSKAQLARETHCEQIKRATFTRHPPRSARAPQP